MLVLRPFQKDALARLKKGAVHLLCISPTGSGKSLVYERVAAEPGRKTLLISPLVALARQQALRLRELSIPVVLQAGAKPKPSAPQGAGVWIISPESLQNPGMRGRLKQWNPDFLVVDECHCLYDWGDRFRLSFREIPRLLDELDIPRSLWLTATLPPDGRRELQRDLPRLETIGEFRLPGNIDLSVSHLPWIHRVNYLHRMIREEREAGIIFVNTRDSTRRIQNLLAGAGRRALIYHAGLGHEERCQIERLCRMDTNAVLVATSAFGMGMDYPSFRWSVLWQPPGSLLALAQALGRIGRTKSARAHATLLWDEEDFRNLRWLTTGSPRQKLSFQEVRTYLTTSQCRVRGLQNYFNGATGTAAPGRCGSCDFCKGIRLADQIPC